MNHRKNEHKIEKKCRYFLEGRCNFGENMYWYSHENEKEKQIDAVTDQGNKCFSCGTMFEKKQASMTHKKEINGKNNICKYFQMNVCRFTENCWFSHEVLKTCFLWKEM